MRKLRNNFKTNEGSSRRIFVVLAVLTLALISFCVPSATAQQPAILGTAGSSNAAVVFPDGNTPGVQNIVPGLPANAAPHAVAYFGQDNAIISDFNNGRVHVVQISTASLLSTITTSPSYSGMGTIAVAPNLNAALAQANTTTLSVIRAPFVAGATINQVAMPGIINTYQTQAIVFNNAGRAFVSHSTGISVLDAPYTSIAFTIPVAGNSSTGAIGISPDGNTLLTTLLSGATVRIYQAPFSAASTFTSLSVPGGNGLDGIMVAPDGSSAIVVSAFARHAAAILSPFSSSSNVQTIPLPANGGTIGFEDVGISADSQLAILTGNGGASAAEQAILVRAPFGAASVTSLIPITGTTNTGRGSGAVRFLPPGLAPGLTISKTAPSTVAPGADLTYTINYANTGTANASDVVIRDPLPAGTTFVSASNGGTLVSGGVVFNVGTLVANSGTLSVSFTVTVNTGAGGTVNNDNYTIEGTGITPVPGPPVTTSVVGATATATSTPTATFTPTSTFTPTPTATNTATDTPTNTATDTPTSTATNTATNTPTAAGTPNQCGLSGSVNDTGDKVNLSDEGTADWAHWGLKSATDFNHKDGAAQQISNYTVVGTGQVFQFGDNATSYFWNDGTPAVAADTDSGVYVIGLNNGFQITVPADTTPRTLKVYVGLFKARGRFTASLSDGSSPDFVNTSVVNSTGASNEAFTINYCAASDEQTLTIRWTVNQSFSQFGNVTLQAATLVGKVGATPTATATATPGNGTLSGSQGLTPTNVNLSAEGTADWAHWGLNTAGSFNHKNGVTQQISNFTAAGSAPVSRFRNSRTYSWIDGTPTASANTRTGVYVIGVNNGFQITTPADTTVRTLKVYVGVYEARGRFEASLSDDSAPAYVDTSLLNPPSGNGVYTLNYKAASAGQTLTIKWTVNTSSNPFGNVTLQAATLVENAAGTPAPTATQTFTPMSTATNTLTPTATNTATDTPTTTATETFTPTATNTATNTPTPTATQTFTPTATNTATDTPTPTATETFTPTPTATNTPITTSLTIKTFLPSELDVNGVGPPAPTGGIVYLNGVETAVTGQSGEITLHLQPGTFNVEVKLFPSNAGESSITLAAGETRELILVLSDGKEIADDTNLVIDQLQNGILARTFNAVTLRFVDENSVFVPLQSADYVDLLDPNGGAPIDVTSLFTLQTDGSLMLNDVTAFRNILLARTGKISLTVHGESSNGRIQNSVVDFFVSAFNVTGRLVAPPSNPALSVSGLSVTGKILNTSLIFNAVTDATGNFAFPLLPRGNLEFTSETSQNGLYYYGQGILELNGNKALTVNMLNTTDLINGIPPFSVTNLPPSLTENPESSDRSDENTAVLNQRRDEDRSENPVVESPQSITGVGTVSVAVTAGPQGVPQNATATLDVPQGTTSVSLTYTIQTDEYPTYVLAQSVYNDTWSLAVRAGGSGQELIPTITRQINSQLSSPPVWQSNGTTGQIKQTINVANLTSSSAATLILFASATNVGDSILPTRVNASLGPESGVKINSISGDSSVPLNFHSIPRSGLGSGSNNHFNRFFTVNISKPTGSTVTRVTVNLQAGAQTMMVVDAAPGTTTVQEIDAQTLKVNVAMKPIESTIGGVPPPSHPLTYTVKIFVDVNGTEVTDEKQSGGRRALWRMPDGLARYGARDTGGDNWCSRGTYGWLSANSSLITRIDDISGEHGRNIGHQTHQHGTDIDMYHFYQFPGAVSGGDNYAKLIADTVLAIQPDDIGLAAKARVIAWVTATQTGLTALAANTSVIELRYTRGGAGGGLNAGWSRDLLKTGTTTVNGQTLDLGTGAWNTSKYIPVNDHNDHVHITLSRTALGE